MEPCCSWATSTFVRCTVTRRLLIGIAIGAGLLLALDAMAARLGVATSIVPTVQGTAAWTTSRAAGITAFLALTLDVVFGLLMSTRAGDAIIPRARSVSVHRWLSSVTLALVVTHSFVLLADRFVRFDVIDAIVPFSSSYRTFAVGLGVLAGYGALVVHISFALRRRIGTRNWRRLHFVSFGIFLAALVHGLFAGSDSSSAAMHVIYVGASSTVALLALLRLLGGSKRFARS